MSSGSNRDDSLQIPALGRPFNLGMLYDARNDAIIAGPTLWNNATLKANVARGENDYSNVKILRNDTLTEKTNALNITGELKLSLLAGLFPIDGSGKYLKDNFDRSTRERITFWYKSTAHWEKLGMDHLEKEKIEHHQAFQDSAATHVVTQIQYGADAFFVFDRQKSSKQNKTDAGTSAGMKFSELTFQVGVGGKAEYTSKEADSSETYECNYYGDFKMPTFPKTLADAEQFVKGIHENLVVRPVPKTVYLYPLSKLNPSAPRMMAKIGTSLMSKTEDQLKTIIDTRIAANTILMQPDLKNFNALEKEITEYLTYLDSSEQLLQTKLCEILPKIRGGDGTEGELAEVLKIWKYSIFGKKMMEETVRDFQEELNCLTNYLNVIKEDGIDILTESNVKYSYDSESSFSLALEFRIADFRTNLIEQCNKFIDDPKTPVDAKQLQEAWFKDEEQLRQLHLSVDLFRSCAEDRTDTEELSVKPTSFVCRPSMQKTRSGKTPPKLPISIVAYKSGKGTPVHLPFIEDEPQVLKVTSTSAELSWKMPTAGAEHIMEFLVLVKKDEEDYKTHMIVRKCDCAGTTSCATVAKLKPGTEYCFRIQPVTQWGLTKPSPESPSYTTIASNLHKSLPDIVKLLKDQKKKNIMDTDTSSTRPNANSENTTKKTEAAEKGTKSVLLGICDECYEVMRHLSYKCTICEGFAICNNCMDKGKHAKHAMKKFVKESKQNPMVEPKKSSILCAGSQVNTNVAL